MIKQAGMMLTDDELEQVAGGRIYKFGGNSVYDFDSEVHCSCDNPYEGKRGIDVSGRNYVL